MVVPHSFNDRDTFLPVWGYYRGPAWYRLSLPEIEPGLRAELVALGAFSVTDVWLNGDHLGRFQGGFTGFDVDLTPRLREHRPNVLALRVTNEHDPEVLPGMERPDYYLYGGLYREVFLRTTENVYIPRRGVVVTTPYVRTEKASVDVAVELVGTRLAETRATVRAEIIGPEGEAASSREAYTTLSANGRGSVEFSFPDLPSPKLWSPDSPSLYEARVTLLAEGRKLGEERVPFGLRWFRFDADDGFILNGRPLKLRGVNRHQDYPGLGNALAPRLQEHDVELIKSLGANFVRCSHYPMHPAFLDACDRQGVLVYEEIASWQHIGGEPFAKNAEAMMEEMIARDRHHPSVILWGLLNEGRDKSLFSRLHETAKRCDPSRPTTYAENYPEDGNRLGTTDIPDVLGINYSMPEIDRMREIVGHRPMLSSEFANANIERGDLRGELGQAEFILTDLTVLESLDWLAGTALWSMHDYGTDMDIVWPLQKSGVFDAWRLPKVATHALKARWNKVPHIHVVGGWYHPGRKGELVNVAVFTNAESVELFVNGESQGRRPADKARMWRIAYQPGALQAVGYGNHGPVIDEIQTPGNPEGNGSVLVEPLHDTLSADGSDMTLITATIVDGNGLPVPRIRKPVSFEVSLDGEPGGATLCGVGGMHGAVTVDGKCRIALRAGSVPGVLRVVAHAPSMQSGKAEVRLVEPPPFTASW